MTLEGLIERLALHGILVGVDPCLRLKTVLATRDPWPWERFRNVVIAILASSPEDVDAIETALDLWREEADGAWSSVPREVAFEPPTKGPQSEKTDEPSWLQEDPGDPQDEVRVSAASDPVRLSGGPTRFWLAPSEPAQPLLLDREAAELLAWGVGQQTSPLPTFELDVEASIEATAEAAGFPTFHWEHWHRPGRVMLWLDAAAEGDLAPFLAREYQSILEGWKLEVDLLRFWEVPSRLEQAGTSVVPSQLEEVRQQSWVAVLTDGRGLLRREQDPEEGPQIRRLLQQLAKRQHLAFVDTGPPRQRPHLEHLLAPYDLPVLDSRQLATFVSTGGEEHGEHLRESSLGPVWMWAACCALFPLAVPATDALALRSALELPVSPHALPLLTAASVSRTGIQFAPDVRRDLVQRLRAALPGTAAGEATPRMLRQVVDFWRERVQRDAPDWEFDGTGRGLHRRLVLALLEMWVEPEAAGETLQTLRESPYFPEVLHELAQMKPAGVEDSGLDLPFQLEQVEAPSRQQPRGLETRVSEQGFIEGRRFRELWVAAERRVCAIDILHEETGFSGGATGFLVGPDLVLTCSHALRGFVPSASASPPAGYKVVFRFFGGAGSHQGTYAVPEVELAASRWLLASDPEDFNDPEVDLLQDGLDYVVVRLSERVGEDGRGWFELPNREPPLSDSFLGILQRPDLGFRSFVFESQGVLGQDPTGMRLRHRVGTESGSSGAPCFDAQWNLVAVHQADLSHQSSTADREEFKQAIPIHRIRQDLERRNLYPLAVEAQPPSARFEQTGTPILVILFAGERGQARARQLANESRVSPELMARLGNEPPVSDTDNAVAVFLGDEESVQNESLTDTVQELLRLRVPVIPVVEDLQKLYRQLPTELHELRAFQWASDPTDLGRLVSRVRQLFGLEVDPAQRSVYISYSRVDHASEVGELTEALRELGFDVQSDTELSPGQDVSETLERDLTGRSSLLYIESANSWQSEWIRLELTLALTRGLGVVVLQRGQVERRHSLVGSLPVIISDPRRPIAEEAERIAVALDHQIARASLRLLGVGRSLEALLEAQPGIRNVMLEWETSDVMLVTFETQLWARDYRQRYLVWVAPHRPTVELGQHLVEIHDEREVDGAILIYEAPESPFDEAETKVLTQLAGDRRFFWLERHEMAAGVRELVSSLADRGSYFGLRPSSRDRPVARVFLSVGLPPADLQMLRQREDAWEDFFLGYETLPEETVSAVTAVVTQLLGANATLVFGGHPALAPLITDIGRRVQVKRKRLSIEMFQSAFFAGREAFDRDRDEVIYRHIRWIPIHRRVRGDEGAEVGGLESTPANPREPEEIEPVTGPFALGEYPLDRSDHRQAVEKLSTLRKGELARWRTASLTAMRREMLQSCDAAVLLGGMGGIEEELALFDQVNPGSPVWLLTRPGGRTERIAATSSLRPHWHVEEGRTYDAIALRILESVTELGDGERGSGRVGFPLEEA